MRPQAPQVLRALAREWRRRLARFDTPEDAEIPEQRLHAPAPAEAQSPEIAALAARLAQLEDQLAVAQEQHVDGPGDGVFSYVTKGG